MPQTTRLTRDGVRLPSSSATRESRYKSFAKLLYHVEPHAATGFGFHGKICKPGAMVRESELWPSEEYPPRPVLLEYVAGAGRERGAGVLYVLWSFDSARREWIELGRAMAAAAEWSTILRPLALQALRPPRKPAGCAHDVGAVAERIVAALDAELRPIEYAEQLQVLNAVHDQLAVRICRAS